MKSAFRGYRVDSAQASHLSKVPCDGLLAATRHVETNPALVQFGPETNLRREDLNISPLTDLMDRRALHFAGFGLQRRVNQRALLASIHSPTSNVLNQISIEIT